MWLSEWPKRDGWTIDQWDSEWRKLNNFEEDGLSTWLRTHQLDKYEAALRDGLGATVVADLRELTTAEWEELGLKPLEAKRALRELAEG